METGDKETSFRYLLAKMKFSFFFSFLFWQKKKLLSARNISHLDILFFSIICFFFYFATNFFKKSLESVLIKNVEIFVK